MLWVILGRMREAREEVWEEAEVVHSDRMVLLCAIQELGVANSLSAFIKSNPYQPCVVQTKQFGGDLL